jgi:hypothetical protein
MHRPKQSKKSRTGFVEDDFDIFIRILEQGEQEGDFWDGVISTTGMAANTASGGRGGEQNDDISQELDVEQQILPLLVR